MSINSSFISDLPLVYHCSTSQARFFIMVGFSAVKALLLLPLSILVLYLGLQRWRQQRSFNSVSHSDVLTYHLAAMELFWAPGLVCYLCGTYFINVTAVYAGLLGFSITFYGEFFFYSFTCVDRYLAVVHPIIYLRLKNVAGIRIRNVSIASVWLLCVGITGFQMDVSGSNAIVFMFCILAVNLTVITFCNFSVLRALIRPGPREGVIKIDPLKQRAFNTITAISCVLWLWFVALIVTAALSQSTLLSEEVGCILLAVVSWFNLPTSLVSPLLYLTYLGFFAVKTILVSPLCAFAFFLGIQRWRQWSSSKPVSQSGILTFQLIAMELLWGPGFVFCVDWYLAVVHPIIYVQCSFVTVYQHISSTISSGKRSFLCHQVFSRHVG